VRQVCTQSATPERWNEETKKKATYLTKQLTRLDFAVQLDPLPVAA